MNYKFEKERARLLISYTYYSFPAYHEKLKKQFFKLIELVIFDMLKTDYFFGKIIVQMGRDIQLEKKEMLTLGINIDEFDLIFNPTLFLQLDFEEMKKRIIHEMLHLFFQHPAQYQRLKNRFSYSAINRALDQDLEDRRNGNDSNNLDELVENFQREEEKTGAEQRSDNSQRDSQGNSQNSSRNSPKGNSSMDNRESQHKISKNFTDELEALRNSMMESEEFHELPQELQDKIKDQIADENGRKTSSKDRQNSFPLENENLSDFHSGWDKNGEFDPRSINKAFYKIVENVLEKDRGLLPGYLEGYFLKLLSGKAELKWQQILKRELGKLPVPYRKTITRKDRRQPERLDVKGRLPKHICKIFVAIDTSGSMGEKELEYAFNEIFGIIKNYEYKLTVIECDAAVEKVYEVKRKRDIQFKVHGRGGTAFQPVFDYLEKRREREYLLVYFTDGYGESNLKERPKGGRVLWVITGGSPQDLSLKKPYGSVRSLDFKK